MRKAEINKIRNDKEKKTMMQQKLKYMLNNNQNKFYANKLKNLNVIIAFQGTITRKFNCQGYNKLK